MTPSHHRCLIHPQQNRVGVCSICLRERLLALEAGHDTTITAAAKAPPIATAIPVLSACAPLSNDTDAASAASQGGEAFRRSPGPVCSNIRAGTARSLAMVEEREEEEGEEGEGGHQEVAMAGGFWQRSKSRRATSVPQSPDRSFFMSSCTGHHQRRSVSAWASPTTAGLRRRRDMMGGPSSHHRNMSLPPSHHHVSNGRKSNASESAEHLFNGKSTAGNKKRPSLWSLFHQSHQSEQQQQSSAGKIKLPDMHFATNPTPKSPGFNARLRAGGAAVSDYRQAYLADLAGINAATSSKKASGSSSNGSASWIASLFHLRSSSKYKPPKPPKGTFNSETTTAYVNGLFESSARPSMDSVAGRSSLSMDFKAQISGGNSGTANSVTTKLAKLADEENADQPDSNDASAERRFLRSRSWGRAWSKTLASPLWTGSKHQANHAVNRGLDQGFNKDHEMRHSNSTPKQYDKDSRASFGFYMSPLRRIRHAAGGSIQFPH